MNKYAMGLAVFDGDIKTADGAEAELRAHFAAQCQPDRNFTVPPTVDRDYDPFTCSTAITLVAEWSDPDGRPS